MRRNLSCLSNILSVNIFISVNDSNIFWTLDSKARIFEPEEKEKVPHLSMCFSSSQPTFPLLP